LVVPTPPLTDAAAWSSMFRNSTPFAPSFAAARLSRRITASVFPCEVNENECLLEL
jgi:hypothetical protein